MRDGGCVRDGVCDLGGAVSESLLGDSAMVVESQSGPASYHFILSLGILNFVSEM